MTCIVGIRTKEGHVHLGADACAGDPTYYTRWEHTGAKVISWPKTSGICLGYTTSFRMGQVIEHHLVPPLLTQEDARSPHAWLVREFVPLLRTALREHGVFKVEHERETGGEMLVGFEGGLYHICPDFSVLRRADDYDAIGSGAAYALGAMKVARRMLGSQYVQTAQDVLREGLEAAVAHSAYVMQPYTFFEVPR